MSGALIGWTPLKSHSMKRSGLLRNTSNIGCLKIASLRMSFDSLKLSMTTLEPIKVNSVPFLLRGGSFSASNLAFPKERLSRVLPSIRIERLKLSRVVLNFIFSNEVRNDNRPVPYLPVLILFNFGEIGSWLLWGDPSNKNFSMLL